MTENVNTRVSTAEGRYDYVWKVVLLGDSGVGKSSLLHRFTQNEFKEDIRSGIIGDDLSTKILEVDGETVKVKFWDSYGKERFKSLNQAFYRGATGAVLVYDITKISTFEHLENWLDDLMLHNETAVIMLLGNKCDLNESREVPASKAELFADQNGLLFMEASARDAMYVAAAFQSLCNEIYKVVADKTEDEKIDDGTFHDTVATQPNKLDQASPKNRPKSEQTVAGSGQDSTRTAPLSKTLCCTYV